MKWPPPTIIYFIIVLRPRIRNRHELRCPEHLVTADFRGKTENLPLSITLKLSARGKKNSPYCSGLCTFFSVLHSLYTTEHILWWLNYIYYLLYLFIIKSFFGLHVQSCTPWLRPRNPPPSPHPPRLGSFTRALLVSQDRRHLFVTPCFEFIHPCLHPLSQ